MSEQVGHAARALPPEVYAELVEDAPVGICVIQDGHIVYGNRWLTQFSGYHPGDLPLDARAIIHPDDRPKVDEQLRLQLTGAPALPSYPVRFLHRDRTEHDGELHAKLISYLGRPAIQGTLVDIGAETEVDRLRQSRKLLEHQIADRTSALEATNRELREEIEQRRQSENRLRLFAAAVEGAAEGFYLFDLGGRIIYVNRAVETLSGTPAKEYIGQPVSCLHADPDVPTRVIMPAILRNGFWTGEIRSRTRDGRMLTLWLAASLVRDSEDRPIAMVGITKDLSAQKRVAEDHIKIQKLESIGVLAGGLAHDFNNLLTIILGNLDLARLFCSENAEATEALDHAAEAAMRAGDLTRQLITFSRGGQPVKRIGNIGRTVRETVAFAATGSSLACEFDLPDGLPPVEFDEGQMRQVIHNLVQNAREAMPGGGTLRVSAGAVQFGEDEIVSLPPGRYLRLQFADNGTGIPREHLNRIFDPYFSTKEMDAVKGRGMGLAVSYSIVRSHGGAIVADSGVEGGTTISVYLPETSLELDEESRESEEPGAEASPAPDEPAASLEREPDGPPRGRVLVMDDEPLVLEIAGAALRRLGYAATLCHSSAEAIVQYQIGLDSGRRFDTVILDLTVPGGPGGPETLVRLREIDPGIRAVLSSGYTEHPAVRNWAAAGFGAFIAKPYSLKAFEELLTNLM